jgi:hypothetical protein
VAIRKDVRSLEKLMVAQATDCTELPVSLQNSFPERALMKPNLRGNSDVPAPRIIMVFPDQVFQSSFNRNGTSIVDRNAERKIQWTVIDHKHWVDRDVSSRNHAEEIDDWNTSCHGETKPDVVRVQRISLSVAIFQQAIRVDAVIIWTRPAFYLRNRCNREWDLAQNCRSEDPLRADHRHTLTFEIEPTRKNLARDDVPVPLSLLV